MKAWAIAVNSLRRLARDRSSLFFTAALPVAIILLIGLATAGFDDDTIQVGLVDEGSGALGAEFVASMEDSPRLDVRRFADPDELRRAVRRGAVGAGIVVPAGYDDTLRSGERAQIVLVADPTRGLSQAIRTLVSAIAAEQGALIQAATFATARAGGAFETNLAEAQDVAELVPPVGVEIQTLGRDDGSSNLMAGFDYTAPANLVLFVFITSLAGASILIETRRLGITERMYSTPTSARTIVAGELGGRFGIALAQAAFILVVGRVAFGVGWGDPLGAAALVGLFVLVATAFGVLFGTVLRTPQQAGSIGPIAGIGMGMLSGCMWPREVMPEFMQRIGQLFPHAWAMDGWIALIARGEGIAGILPQLAVLGGFVVVLLPLATWRLRRAIAS